MMVQMRVALLCSLLVLLAACAPPPAPPDPQLWGTLKPGPYAVGFGLRWETDPSRTYGLEKDGVTKRPRPIPVGVWYPARPSPAEHMQVADYFDMRSKQVQFDELAAKLNAHIREIVAQSMGDPTAVNRFLAMRTSATFDAPPAKGQFPVVIYCSNGSYAEDFVLFEYLASNGYVVLSTSDHSDDPAVPWPGIDLTRMRDMYFLDRFAALLGNADASHLASMGFGLGAVNALAWAEERDTPLDAVVAFEPIWPMPKGSLVASSSSKVATIVFSAFPDASRRSFEVVIPGMAGNFITVRIVRETARSHREDYDRVCRLTLLFLDAHLKRNPSALAEFRRLSQK
jgi:hypothetical protein